MLTFLGYRWCCLRKLVQCSTEVPEDTLNEFLVVRDDAIL